MTRRTFDVTVDAVCWTGDNMGDIEKFFGMAYNAIHNRMLPRGTSFEQSIMAPNYVLIPDRDGKYLMVPQEHWILRYPDGRIKVVPYGEMMEPPAHKQPRLVLWRGTPEGFIEIRESIAEFNPYFVDETLYVHYPTGLGKFTVQKDHALVWDEGQPHSFRSVHASEIYKTLYPNLTDVKQNP